MTHKTTLSRGQGRFFQQQNRLYPARRHRAATTIIKKDFGKIRARNSPTPTQNKASPQTRRMLSVLLSQRPSLHYMQKSFCRFPDKSLSLPFSNSYVLLFLFFLFFGIFLSFDAALSLAPLKTSPSFLSVNLLRKSGTISRILVSPS